MISQSNPLARAKRKQTNFVRSFVELLESRCLLSTSASETIVTPHAIISPDASSSSGIQGYTPAQIRTAYGITGDGSGQTIAIVDAFSDPNIASDLSVFDKQFGLGAPPSFSQVSSNGSPRKLPTADAGWDSEIALDVEWAHAIAPKANIILVDAASDSLASLMTAVDFARSISSVSVISMSWGTGEFRGQTSYDSTFTTPSGHTGITFVAASGDEGASGGAEWPAVSSNVLSVGGTTLTLSSTGAIASETAWSDSSGGASSYETLAAQSSATGVQSRTSPDVSYDANPNTGFAVYDSVAYEGYVGWQEVGGTSAGAPQWAAIIAIADAARVAAKSTTLTTAQTLSDIYSIYTNTSSYAANFRDITSGASYLSSEWTGFRGRFGMRIDTYLSASTGYDSLTGIGSPKAASLIAALTSNATASIKSSAFTKTSTASAKAAATKKAIVADNQIELQLPATTLTLDITHNSQPFFTIAASLPSPQTSATIAALNSDDQSTTNNSTTTFAVPVAQAIQLTRSRDPYNTIETLQHVAPLVQSTTHTDSWASSITYILNNARRQLHHSINGVEKGIAAISSSIANRQNDRARAAIILIYMFANGIAVVYRYNRRKTKRSTHRTATFNTKQPIELFDSTTFAY